MPIATESELRESARRWRERATMEHFGGQHADSLACAGVSLEHLCKAYLVRFDPALIAEPGNQNFDALLHQLNLGHLAKAAPRTIGAAVAWDRVQRLSPLSVDGAQIKQLIEIRNGSLHSGYFTGGAAQQLFLEFVEATNQLEEALEPGQRAEQVWPRYLDMIERLKEEDDTNRRSDLAQRLADSKRVLESTFRGVSAGEVAEIKSRLRGGNRQLLEREVRDPFEWGINGDANLTRVEFVTCPQVLCGDRQALALGWVSEPADEDEAFLFFPTQVRCGICQLHLPTNLHLVAAGISTHWVVDGARPAD